jgi:uncharacterized protein with HEPN domain
MTRHDDAMSLRHMLDHATEAVEMAQGRRREDLDSDRQLNLCLVRLVEVVGEAASRVTQSTRRKLAIIPWAAVVGLRNRLIHAYDKVDFNILWDVVQLDLPPLIEQLKTALGFAGGNQI